MYLTRVQIELGGALYAGLTDAYAWHQSLWTAFPGRDGAKRDFLSRVDERGRQQEALVLSPIAPTPRTWGRWETRQVVSGFLRHTRYAFALRANPTIKRVVRDDSGERRKNGRRTRICGADELRAWIERKAADSGFRVEEGYTVSDPVDQICWRCRRKVVHARVDYQGVLTVTEPEAFQRAYCTGIGPAKAFGFGLLLLRPLRQEGR
ncbi:MAG: type I-E CRISPR-associated protein Cas6/Cse3/CasE [Candidatus Latescibacterota bacterium]